MAEWYQEMAFRPNSILMNRTVIPSQSHSTQWIDYNTSKNIFELYFILKL